MNIYTLGSNFEPHRRLLTGAGSGSRRQNGGFGGAKVLAVGNARWLELSSQISQMESRYIIFILYDYLTERPQTLATQARLHPTAAHFGSHFLHASILLYIT